MAAEGGVEAGKMDEGVRRYKLADVRCMTTIVNDVALHT